MKSFKPFLASIILFFAFSGAAVKADDLNTRKMEKITKEILESMVKQDNTSEKLRKYISEEWLDKKNLNVKKYKINNYSPEHFEILYAGGDICVAVIGGSSWSHMLIFKFTEEYGMYRVVPMGISQASADYIDPWFVVKDYICLEKEEPDQEK